MKRFFGLALRALSVVACVVSPVLLRSQGVARSALREYVLGQPVVAGEVLVRFRDDAFSRMAQIERDIDVDDSRPIGAGAWRRLHSSSRTVQAMLTSLSSRSDVLEVEPNYIVHSTAAPNDPAFYTLWGLNNVSHPGADIHVISAWDVSTGSTANVVGMIDTGVDYTHPDLAANMWSAPVQFTVTVGGQSITCPAGSHGFNAIAFSCDPMDDNFHGTHTAGTVGAVGNNSIGVVGVNWTTRMMALKFLDSNGSGSLGDAVNAIDFAIQTKARFAGTNGANVRVLSNSWGAYGSSGSLLSAIQRAASADMLFVAAAGNSGLNNDASPFYPASYTTANVVAVAATDANDALASFSNYGPTSVDLAAPGTNITSTVAGGSYAALDGTSMATPHVAGAAALLLSACALTTAQLKTALLNNVDVIPSVTGLVQTNGRLNVDRAIRGCATVPVVALTNPVEGANYTAPATITLGANASDPDGIARVEFYQGSTLIGTSTSAPFGGTWSTVQPGSYTLTAKAFDTREIATVSTPVHVTVTAASGAPSATFVSTDTTTQGNWQSVYGVDGYNVINHAVSYPTYATVTTGASNWTWAPSTSDIRALLKTSGIDRLAATWYGGAFSIDINVTDGAVHQLALYVVDWDAFNRIERIEFHDAVTDALLDSRTVSGFHNGQYWRWNIGGHVKVQVIGLAGVNAVVNGLFFDVLVNTPPTVTLTAPSDGATFVAPGPIVLSANANDSNGITRVEFYETPTGGQPTLIGQPVTVGSPYQTSWSNVAAGSYTLTAKAFDQLGASRTSAPVQITVTGSGSSATFVSTDTTTEGNWLGVYGVDGYHVINHAVSYPAYATVTPSGVNSWTWAASTSDVRALQKTSGTDRLAATWYGGAFSIDINVTDGAVHQLALYVVDWDAFNRIERIEFHDAVTDALLDSRTVSGFHNGQYWRWNIGGHVKVQVIGVAGVNAVVNGLFFDALVNTPPTVTLTAPGDGATFVAPGPIALSANANDTNGINRVEFYQTPAGGQPTLIGQPVTGGSPYQTTWSNVAAGSYTLTAKAFDQLGASRTSAPVQITVTGGGSSATFVSTDTTTQGNWLGAYGADGYHVINHAVSYPAYATVTPTGTSSWTWAASTSDVRALQKTSGTDRLAAAWYGGAFSIDINVTDGAVHQLALYVVDWDAFNRIERIEFHDAVTDALLDSRTVSGFNGGQYLRWMVSGHVVVRVVGIAGANAVINGLFFN